MGWEFFVLDLPRTGCLKRVLGLLPIRRVKPVGKVELVAGVSTVPADKRPIR